MPDEPKQSTVGEMLSFTDFLIDKKYAARSAVKPLQTAIEQVFSSVYGEDGYREVDPLNVDLDELMRRFANATGTRYKAESRQAYRARLARIIGVYREHLDHPDAPPNLPTRKRAPRSTTPTAATLPEEQTNGDGGVVAPPPATAPSPPSSGTRSYSLPLRNGDATLTIPREFYQEDADRLSKLIESLVFEPMRQLSAQTDDESE
jgi:hypothetical protein